tara:strand:- start:4556 stop:4891 length:336 start_codon:yes stop_codon:yes gene_type:complete
LVDPPTGADAHGGVAWNIYVERGWLMVLGAVMAAGALYLRRRDGWHVGLLALQQFVLLVGFAGAVFHLFDNTFAGSRVLMVLPVAGAAAVIHELAIIKPYLERRWKHLRSP